MTHLNLKSLLLGLLVALSMTMQIKPASALIWSGDYSSTHSSKFGIFSGTKSNATVQNMLNGGNYSVEQLCAKDGSYETYQKFLDVHMPALYIFFSPVYCYPSQAERHIKSCTHGKTFLPYYTAEAVNFKWWSGIFTALSNASENVTNAVFDQVAGGCIKLLAAGLAIWLALTTLPMVASLKEQNPADYLMKVGTILFKAMIAVFLLQHRDWFFEYLVGPIISVAAGFVGLDTGNAVGVKAVTEPLRTMMDQMHYTLSEVTAVGKALQCLGMWIGAFMFSFGININILFINFRVGMDLPVFPIPNLSILFGGCATWLCAIFLGIVFPLRVFDAIFRLGIILALSPLYIISWVFPVTADFAKKGLSSILHIAFLFIALYIGLFLTSNLMFAASGIDKSLMEGDATKAAVAIMMPFISAGSAIKTIFVLLITTAFCVKMLMKTDEIAGHFAGASFNSSAASGIASMGVGAAKKALLEPAAGLAGKGMKALGGKAKTALANAHTAHQAHAMDKLQAVTKRYNSASKTADANGRLTDKQARRDERYLSRHGVVDANAQKLLRKRDMEIANAGESKDAKALADAWQERGPDGKLKNADMRRKEEILIKAGLLDEKGQKIPPKASETASNAENSGTPSDNGSAQQQSNGESAGKPVDAEAPKKETSPQAGTSGSQEQN